LWYRWLTGDKAIDHSTLGKFYAEYIDEIVELFSQVVMLCQEHGLIDFDILAIDSMKFRANASHKQSKALETIEKEESKIEERLRQLIEAAAGDGSMQEEEQKSLAGRLEEVKTVLQGRTKIKASAGSEK